MLGSCREVPEEELPKSFWKSAHAATSWKEALPTTGLDKSCHVTGHHTPRRSKKLCYAPDCSWNNQTCKGTRETQILPPVLWDLLDVIIPLPHASALSKPFKTTSPILFIPQRATNRTQRITFLSLFVLPGSLQAEQCKPPVHAAVQDAEWHKTLFPGI